MTNTKKLKACMLMCDITQDQLAEKLNVSRATINYKINNVRQFYSKEVKLIQEVLNLSDLERDEIFFADNVDKMATK